jgi:DNA-binding FadR family transcriptional regulator
LSGHVFIPRDIVDVAPMSRLPATATEQRRQPRVRKPGSAVIGFVRNMHSHVASTLGREIIGGIFPPGALLPNEAELSARFSVSRTVLREAYSLLNAKGLIVARPRIGTRVRPKAEWNMLDPEVLTWHVQSVPTEEFIDELYTLRLMVEPTAAAIVAGSGSRTVIERIAAAYADMERFKNGDGDLVAADLQFHSAILDGTGNRFVNALGSLIEAALIGTFALSWEGAARMRDGRLHQHLAVLDAIREGKPEAAQQNMSDLLRESIYDIREILRRRDAKPARRSAAAT